MDLRITLLLCLFVISTVYANAIPPDDRSSDDDEDDFDNRSGRVDDAVRSEALSAADLDAGELDSEEVAADGGEFSEPDEKATKARPNFLSVETTTEVRINDTIHIECKIDDDHNKAFVLMWKKGANLLSIGNMKMSKDTRIVTQSKSQTESSLTISHAVAADSGVYTCSISTQPATDQNHTIVILMPPKIKVTPLEMIMVTKGDTVELGCKILSGQPRPKISWTKNDGNDVTNGILSVSGETLTLANIDRHSSGRYTCTASNGIGDPQTENISVKVIHKPELELRTKQLMMAHTPILELFCIVHYEPPGDVHWTKDHTRLVSTNKISIQDAGHIQTLKVQGFKDEDFGNYTCHAKNRLGAAFATTVISGQPGPVTVTGHPRPSPEEYLLTFKTEAFSPIIDYKLLLKKVNDMTNGDEWTEVVIPVSEVDLSANSIYDHSYHVKSLEKGVNYEVVMQARNKYGLGPRGNVFEFQTNSKGVGFSLGEEDNKIIEEMPEVEHKREETPSSAIRLSTQLSLTALVAVMMAIWIVKL